MSNESTPSANESKQSESESASAIAETKSEPGAEGSGSQAAPAASGEPSGSTEGTDSERPSTEVVEVDPESVPPPANRPPPPRSLRPKTAQDIASVPLGVSAQLPAPLWPPKTVADLMTRKIITVKEGEPIGNLEDWMKKFRFRHLPVVETGMKLVGLITRTDLLHAELGRMPDGTPAPKIDGETLASVIMRRNVVYAQLDTPIATACRVMLDQKLTCVPVVLSDHTLVGILTESDFIRLALDLFQGKTVQR